MPSWPPATKPASFSFTAAISFAEFFVHGGAHPADALREDPRLARIAAAQDRLDAAPHRARRPGVLHLPPVDLEVDAQVPFDAGDGVDGDARAHVFSLGPGLKATGSGLRRDRSGGGVFLPEASLSSACRR